MSQESLLIRAVTKQPIDRFPVWMMRQAGRYLPEYRALKEKYTFLELCRSVELAQEVTLQPITRLDTDAAIVFADILLPLECIGIEFDFCPGPKIDNPIGSASDINDLKYDGLSKVSYVSDLVSSVKRHFSNNYPDKAVLGFAGAPWTLACYITNQKIFKHFQGTQVFAAENPVAFSQMLDLLADLTADYLSSQLESGADAVQLFDTWAGNLTLEDYKTLALPYTMKIFDRLKKYNKPLILYCQQGGHLLEAMAESGATCLSLDSRINLSQAYAKVGDKVSLQGNFDSTWLYKGEDFVESRTQEMLKDFPEKTGLIANLGHGILPTTPVSGASAFINTVKNYQL